MISKHHTLNVSGEDLIGILEEAKATNSRIEVPSPEQMQTYLNMAENVLEQSEKHDIKVLNPSASNYPKRYKGMPDEPLLIYAKGNVEALNHDKTVAIIGTREPTEFGIRAGERLSSIFTKEGFVVVSGLAVGCDTVAHVGCLKENGQTVAVLAGGLDKIYPKENRQLADDILQSNGCLISEYPIGTPARSNFFVERDRLQSGLSQAVIVIETDIKGGTMHTVGFSQKQHRYLACLSGHPERFNDSPKTQGNKMLIREGKAKSLGSPDEIKAFMHLIQNGPSFHLQGSYQMHTHIKEIKPNNSEPKLLFE
jgi:DNA processing protein